MTTVRTKVEVKNEITELENDFYQNEYRYSQQEKKVYKRKIRKLKKEVKKLTPEIVSRGTYEITDYIDSLSYTGKTDRPKTEFLKENSRYYNEKELDILRHVLLYQPDSMPVYNQFNKMYRPENFKREVLSEWQEEVKSSNIYDRMGARSTEQRRDSFEVPTGYDQEPITVYHEYKKDTTLSGSDIRAFM